RPRWLRHTLPRCSSSSWWWSRLGDLPMQIQHRADRLRGCAADLRVGALRELARGATLRRTSVAEAAEEGDAVDANMLLGHAEPALGPVDAIRQIDHAQVDFVPTGSSSRASEA